MDTELELECPHCDSEHTVKAGFCIKVGSRQQRYKCQECGKTFYRKGDEKEEVPAHTT